MKYAYPVIIDRQEDGYYLITAPDLPGVVVGGDTLPDAMQAACDGCAMWLADAENGNETIPAPTDLRAVETTEAQRVALAIADTTEYRRKNDTHAVKKTLSLPAWMVAQADAAGVSLSQVLQEALRERLA